MIRFAATLMGLAVFLLAAPLVTQAKVTETEKKTVTPSGVIIETTYVKGTGSDDLAVGDPYGNRAPSQRALEGPPSTQRSYENCNDPQCLRAKKRQLASPYWKPGVK